MLVNGWTTVLFILWVVAVIAAVAAAIFVWQKEDLKKRVLFCAAAAVIYAVPGLLFLMI